MVTQLFRRPLDLKVFERDEPEGVFMGLAAVFDTADRSGDIILKGAFTKTLQHARERKSTAGDGRTLYPLLFYHDPAQPVGSVVAAFETDKGLAVGVRCDLNTAIGQRIFSGIQQGYVTALSIGYLPRKATRNQQGLRLLHEIDLQEISVVTTGFASNTAALVDPLSVKSNASTAAPPDVTAALGALLTEMQTWLLRR